MCIYFNLNFNVMCGFYCLQALLLKLYLYTPYCKEISSEKKRKIPYTELFIQDMYLAMRQHTDCFILNESYFANLKISLQRKRL